MDDKTLTALKGSIAKWESIVAGTGTDEGQDNCSLCQEFYDNRCVGCPVYEDTGYRHCTGSPYDEWVSHYHDFHSMEVNTKVHCNLCQDYAQAELDFLKSLLPSENEEG